MSDEEDRAKVFAELRRVREAVRERSLAGGAAPSPLPPPRPVASPEPASLAAEPAPVPAPPPPDSALVNATWEARPVEPGGFKGVLFRVLVRLLGPAFEAQRAFNARQVQLDNELLAHLQARAAATHRHYDAVLGVHGRHMLEIDERHMILQEELVGHVHDLVRRIDLVLAEAEKGRLSLEFALRDVRARLQRLEETLSRG